MTDEVTPVDAPATLPADEPVEEEAPEYTTVDNYVVWDSKGGSVLRGTFTEKDDAEAALTDLLTKSHQYLPEHLTVETLPKG